MLWTTCAINTFETIISKLDFQNGFCRRAVALHADDGRQQQQEYKAGQLLHVEGLAVLFCRQSQAAAATRRRAAAAPAQPPPTHRRVDDGIAAAAAASPANLAQAAAVAK